MTKISWFHKKVCNNVNFSTKGWNKENRTTHVLDYCVFVEMWSSVSFSACGLHFFYHYGVAKALLDNNIQSKRVYCSSGGAAIALYYLLDLREEITLETLLDALPWGSRRNSSMFQAMQRTADESPCGIELARKRFLRLIRQVLKSHPDAWKIVSDRLYIYVTAWPWMHSRYISCWSSNKDLYCCLKATTCIPGVDTKFEPVCYRGESFVDGGFMTTHPIRDCNTVIVSTQLISQWWSKAYQIRKCKRPEIGRHFCEGSLEVKKHKFYRQLSDFGYQDATRFLNKRGQLVVDNPEPPQPVIQSCC